MTTLFETQSSDIFADNDPGITFTDNDQAWTIKAGILVSSANSDGVFSQLLDKSALFNNGTILSSASGHAGVELNGTNSFISNAAGARIIAAGVGVFVGGRTGDIDNHGSIVGLAGTGVYFGFISDHVTLNNSGSIHGRNDGVVAFSHVDGGTIHNTGLITSDHVGIEVLTGEGTTTVIDNAAGGTIRGVEDAISVDSGRIVLTNRGTLIGDILIDFDGTEKDVVVNHGKIRGDVSLGAGNDIFNGAGGTSGSVDGKAGNDQLTGGSAADLLFGAGGNDRLAGAAGNDQLSGELGLDTLIGGAGHDRFIFDSGLDARLNVDRITDFAVNVDKIVLDDRVFAGVGTHGLLAAGKFHVGATAADAGDRIIYNPKSGFLFYDADGRGGSGEVHFATVAAHLALHNTDFLVATLLAA